MSNNNARDWPAPAKLNLFLHITGRRDDGYHNLQTVFQFIDIGDRLLFDRRSDEQIVRTSGAPGVPAEQDLVVRAAKALRDHVGPTPGVDIAVDKRLPMGAGLGGGSSNAATTLVALNSLWELGLTSSALCEIGLKLGADVPVFVSGTAAWAEGVGEDLEPITLAEPWYVVITPRCHVSTREVFAAADLTRNSAPITIRDFLAGQGKNDCEAVVLKRYPEVAKALDWLLAQGVGARMTGTGASVFAPFESAHQAEAVCARLPADMPGFVARGINQSPLLDRLALETS